MPRRRPMRSSAPSRSARACAPCRARTRASRWWTGSVCGRRRSPSAWLGTPPTATAWRAAADRSLRAAPPGPVCGQPAPLGGRTWSPRSPRAAAAPDGAELAGHPQGLGQRPHRQRGRQLPGVPAQASHQAPRFARDALTQVRQVVLADIEAGDRTAAVALDLRAEATGIDQHVLCLLLAGDAPQVALLDAHRLLLTLFSNLARSPRPAPGEGPGRR